MEITIEELEGGITVIKLAGRMDVAGVREIDDRFAAASGLKAGRMVVDLSGVPFIASIGIRALLSAFRGQANLGGRLVLASAPPRVAEVLDKVGIRAFVEVYPDLQAAAAALTD